MLLPKPPVPSIIRDNSIIAKTRILASAASSCPDGLPSPQFACADEHIGYLFARIRSTMSSEVQQLTQAEFELTSAQASMLMLLKSGQLSGADLARAYGIDASAVTRLLDKLENRGFVVRVRSEADRRIVHLRLTEAGRAMINGLLPLYRKVLQRMLGGFSEAEASVLETLLQRIITNCETPSTEK